VIGAGCLFALWNGGVEERLAAAAFAVGTFAAPLLKDHHWMGTQWSIFAVDLAYLALLMVIALRSRRYWPLFAAGFQFLAILTHVASLVDRDLRAWAYITAGVIWTYLGLGAIVLGTYNHWRERRQTAAL